VRIFFCEDPKRENPKKILARGPDEEYGGHDYQK
jgi:hypothetical protein